jgi:beta-glucoside operon transcriptional antiterminator
MKVIKKINNNVAICLDGNNNELIAFCKGIGFPETPYEFNDLKQVTRTFYSVNPNYINLLDTIPENIFEISVQIIDYASSKLHNELNPNVVFTLADHINFTIERSEKNMQINYPYKYDIKRLYEAEYEIGLKAVEFINRYQHTYLPKEEAVGIALHLINAEYSTPQAAGVKNQDELIDDITELIEDELNVKIDRDGFNFSRFATHVKYILERRDEKDQPNTANNVIIDVLKEKYPEPYQIVLKVKGIIEDSENFKIKDEDLVFLMLHVNRLCTREDCNL